MTGNNQDMVDTPSRLSQEGKNHQEDCLEGCNAKAASMCRDTLSSNAKLFEIGGDKKGKGTSLFKAFTVMCYLDMSRLMLHLF
nr:hypothetical protein [Tanacetum cinerariifolium]